MQSSHLEHTVPYFFDYSDEFKILKVKAPDEIRRPDYFFTVDYKEDLQLVRMVFKALKNEGKHFTMKSVIQLIHKNPELRNINKNLHEGFDH